MFFKKLGKWLAYLAFLGITVLCLLELSYRYYLFDFYKGNFQGLNPPGLLKADSQKPSILAMGDSFTADPRSYIWHLRDSLPGYRIINAAVPGTTIKQAGLMLPKRLRQAQPDLFIYQIYVGNDLFEFRHPTKGAGISNIRKGYWWLADRFWVLGYINSRLPHIRQAIVQDVPTDYDPKDLMQFDVNKYAVRSKMQFRVEPYMVAHSVLLKGQRKADAQAYVRYLQTLLDESSKECRVLILVVPHCMQLNNTYLNRMQQIGAKVTDPKTLFEVDYPFYHFLDSSLQHPKLALLNALPHLQAADSLAPVYFGSDPHLNPHGQEVLGTILLDAIRQQK